MNGSDLLKQCTTTALLEGKRGVVPRQVTRHHRSDLVPDIRCSFPVSFARDLYEGFMRVLFFFLQRETYLKNALYCEIYYIVTEDAATFLLLFRIQ